LGDFYVALKVLNQRVPLELETNRKKTFSFQSPKTTARRRNVIISSPRFNLVLEDFNHIVYCSWMTIAYLCK